MMSAVLDLVGAFASKMDENALFVDSLGIGVVNDIGRCIEKNEDMWMSKNRLNTGLSK